MVVRVQQTSKHRSRLDLLTGQMQSIVHRKADYEVNSGTATASIRGTIFFSRVNEKGTYFCACNGKVHVEDKLGKRAQNLESAHHQPVLFFPDGSMQPAGMEDHEDIDIFQQMFNMSK